MMVAFGDNNSNKNDDPKIHNDDESKQRDTVLDRWLRGLVVAMLLQLLVVLFKTVPLMIDPYAQQQQQYNHFLATYLIISGCMISIFAIGALIRLWRDEDSSTTRTTTPVYHHHNDRAMMMLV